MSNSISSILILACTVNLNAGTETPERSRNSNLVLDLFASCRKISSPTSAGILFTLAATPYAFDDESNRFYRPWVNSVSTDRVFEAGEWLGSGTVHGLTSLSLYSMGKIFRKESTATLGSELFCAQALSSLFSGCLKVVTNRTRPDGAPYAFPSGHSTVAFATAGVIWHRSGRLTGILAQAGAAYVALSRLQENKHYISDLIGGCLLGNYVAYVVTRENSSGNQLAVTPQISLEGVGIILSKRF